MKSYDWLQDLAGQQPYNKERFEEYEAYFKKLYYKKLKKVNRHGCLIKLKKIPVT